MTKKLLFAFAVIGLAVASAKSYTLNLYQAAKVGTTELKPGTYKLELKDNNKAVIRGGNVQSEAGVKVESNGTRYNSTTVRFAESNGQMQIQEIRLGGTNTKIVFDN